LLASVEGSKFIGAPETGADFAAIIYHVRDPQRLPNQAVHNGLRRAHKGH
jgi:hypothetical protein